MRPTPNIHYRSFLDLRFCHTSPSYCGGWYTIKKARQALKVNFLACLAVSTVRKERDSNPWAALGDYTLSRRVSSATRASFQCTTQHIAKAESKTSNLFVSFAETHRYMCAKCKYSHFQQNSAQNVERKLIIWIQKQIQTGNGTLGEVGRELMQACHLIPQTIFPNVRRNIQFHHNTFWLWTRCSEHHTCLILSCRVQVFRPTRVGQSSVSCNTSNSLSIYFKITIPLFWGTAS